MIPEGLRSNAAVLCLYHSIHKEGMGKRWEFPESCRNLKRICFFACNMPDGVI